jgi:hypothetical protein
VTLKLNSIIHGLLLSLVVLVACSMAAPPRGEKGSHREPPIGKQATRQFSVRIIDDQGNPVEGVTVTPWALQSSQGHGWWQEGDRSGMQPKVAITKHDGQATISYPFFRDLEEGTRTIGVSIYADHPDFVYPDAIHIDVPIENDTAYEVKLEKGFRVALRPSVNGQPTDSQQLFAVWSDGRSGLAEDCLERKADGSLRIPPLKAGRHSAIIAKYDGDHITHLSTILDFEVESETMKEVDVPLQKPQVIQGRLSDDAPRPVKNGRVKVMTLNHSAENYDRVHWHSWAPVREDGSFTIDVWPAGEPIQLIALCDGYIARNGQAPPVVPNPRDPENDPYGRPQVFDPTDGESILVEMEPLVECVALTVDEDDNPVAGVQVLSGPNVGWWNWGSQIYCDYLGRSERWLRTRTGGPEPDNFPKPFSGMTDLSGKVKLHLPRGRESLYVSDELYELPAFLGSRRVRIEMIPGETTEVTMQLQAKGTDRLGEWDKLAGVVFGCSTREGRRICALPEVRKKMDEFAKQFREAKNQRDPKLLAEAYSTVSEAFFNANDFEEAAKWQEKAKEQLALLETKGKTD